MEFLRKATQAAGEDFKDLADAVWEQMGDTQGIPQALKNEGKTLGKYALAAQLAMMFNFPDDADMFRDSFNIIGGGPTGANEFTGTMHSILVNASDMAEGTNQEAIQAQGFADISSTSTFDDIRKMLPSLMKEQQPPKLTRGKSNGSTKLL